MGGADSLASTTRYAYDALGALTGATYANEKWDALADIVSNLFCTVERTNWHYGKGGSLREAKGTRCQYDAEDNLVRKTLPDGQVWHYAWEEARDTAT